MADPERSTSLAATGCAWTAKSNAAWITVASGASGSGNGSVGYSVAANTGAARSGTLTVSGQTFTINQSGVTAACVNSLSPTSANVTSGGGTGSINVSANGNCPWTAVSDSSWIKITYGPNGRGNGSATFLVGMNSGAARSGTITVGRANVTVNQAAGNLACTNSLSPNSAFASPNGTAGSVSVSAWARGNGPRSAITHGSRSPRCERKRERQRELLGRSESGQSTKRYATIAGQTFTVTAQRLSQFGLKSNLDVGDAESLAYPDNYFDVVYSWGVVHHSPDTPRAISEVWRVLKSGGVAKVMIYHKHSMVGYMLWVRYALLKFHPTMTLADIYARYLESPGTKAYSVKEARHLFQSFTRVEISTQLTHGDLLTSSAGQRHRGFALSAARLIWPRALIRRFFPGYGLFMLITATK